MTNKLLLESLDLNNLTLIPFDDNIYIHIIQVSKHQVSSQINQWITMYYANELLKNIHPLYSSSEVT